uniref:Uncharacterized protein n=1 Tax=Vitis vinifera TaxID=29760 RepID=F6HRJ8_VITVI
MRLATSYLAAWRAIRACSSFCTILGAATWVRERKCRFEFLVIGTRNRSSNYKES